MDPIKVAFDQQVFLLQEYGGISGYLCNLAKEFSKRPDVETQVVAPLHFNQNLKACGDIKGAGLCLPMLPPKINRLAMEASKFWARHKITQFAPDIIHETYFSYDDFQPKSSKRILTIYDCIHERYSHMFERSEGTTGPKKAAAQRADHVICISESTRRDVIEFCDIPEEKTSVVYLSANEGLHQDTTCELTDIQTDKPFLLYVGSRAGYKNFNGFIEAFAASPRLMNDFEIICFGAGPLSQEELTFIANKGLSKGQIRHYRGSDQILTHLYQKATAFVYPSLYEGFGIPPLEAMAQGCPVISSNTSSLPEVVGNGGEYFDPENQESILAAMEKVLYSPTHLKDLVERGTLQQAKFSWKKCADETLSIYKDLI